MDYSEDLSVTEVSEVITSCLRSVGYVFEGDIGPSKLLDKDPLPTPSRMINHIFWELGTLHGSKFGKFIEFYQDCLIPMLANKNTNGDQLSAQMPGLRKETGWKGRKFKAGEKETITLIHSISTACAYATQALKSEEKSAAAWAYTCQAFEWLGYAKGFASRGPGFDRQEFSSKGAKAKNFKKNQLREWVINEYLAKNWPSPYKASFELADTAIKKARELDTSLSEQRAQKTIYEWLLKANQTTKAE